MSTAISVIILAGGHGKRLGTDKALLEMGGQTLVQRAVATLAALSDDLVVVIRPDQALHLPGARVVNDLAPYQGVLAGIAAGLAAAQHEWSLLVACDMPFLNLDLLRYLIEQADAHDIVVPRLEVGLEPLHALYHRRCLAALESALQAGERRVRAFYSALDVRYVSPEEMARLDPAGRSFFNINTPEDLATARHWLGAQD